MNREIKFRAKIKGIKQPMDVTTIDFGNCVVCIVDPDRGNQQTFDWSEIETFLMPTGLRDKNGKEIWEGDRLKYRPTGVIYEVEWDADEARFSVCAQNDDFLMALGDCDLADAEVIGHIYEGEG